jgi:hypothetical protein
MPVAAIGSAPPGKTNSEEIGKAIEIRRAAFRAGDVSPRK